MAIDLDGGEAAPSPPDGFDIRTLQPGDEHVLHATIHEAFAENWNFQPLTFDELRVQVLERDEFDPSLCWLVRHGLEVAAAVRCTRKRFDMGWVDSLAVRSAWRRRGLGELLLRTAFAEFARRGEQRVGLGVDAQNEAGATRLYERVGMQVVFRANVFRKRFD
jgi:ribosomal protein S18 acetylase RimI-like enzyme